MSITSGFFNSLNGDRRYNADQISNYFEGLISDGVFENVDDRLAVTVGTGMSINVGSGRAFIKSHWLKNDSALTLTLTAGDVQRNRIDLVVLRLDTTENGRSITIEIKEGVASHVALPPSLTRTQSVYELCLAKISVPAGTTQLTQYNITDMRASSQCGWVTGIIKQVDTADLFLQWQTAYEEYYAQSTAAFDEYMATKKAEFNAWFNTLTESLNVNTTIVKYQNSVITEKEVSEINIGISEYKNGDILLVHIGGVLFIEGQEFTINGEGDSAKIILTNSIRANNIVTFVAIKSIIGMR